MAEPLTLEQAKAHLRVVDDAEDDLIAACIADARGWVENYTGLVLTRRTIVEALDGFTSPLRSWPIVSVDGVTYTDADGAAQTLAPSSYIVQAVRRPGGMLAAPGASFPTIYSGVPVTVTLTAGFEDGDAVGAFATNLMRAVKVLLTAYFDNRGAAIGGGDAESVAQELCFRLKRRIL